MKELGIIILYLNKKQSKTCPLKYGDIGMVDIA